MLKIVAAPLHKRLLCRCEHKAWFLKVCIMHILVIPLRPYVCPPCCSDIISCGFTISIHNLHAVPVIGDRHFSLCQHDSHSSLQAIVLCIAGSWLLMVKWTVQCTNDNIKETIAWMGLKNCYTEVALAIWMVENTGYCLHHPAVRPFCWHECSCSS